MARSARLKSKGGSKKASGVKRTNKQFSKLQKRGKIKKQSKKPKRYEPKQPHKAVNGVHEEEEEEVDPSDMLDEKETAHILQTASNYSFWKSNLVDDNRRNKKTTKRTHSSDDDDEEEEYERNPRKDAKYEESKHLKALLPIKERGKLVPQFGKINSEQQSVDDEPGEYVNEGTAAASDDGDSDEDEDDSQPVSTVMLFAKREKKLATRKERIAQLATKVLENPQDNMKCLKELRLMLSDNDRDIYITIRKLVAVSLLEVFKDILPSYRLRARTEKEKQQRMKKETKQLSNYEERLLQHYQAYVQNLEIYLKGLKRKKKIKLSSTAPKSASVPLGELALKCLCDLLATHPNFNFRSNIVNLVVPYMDYNNSEVSDRVCETVRKIYKEDTTGEVSLELVKATARVVKEKNACVQPKVLNTFLALKIKALPPDTTAKKKYLTKKEKMMKLSRKERKRSKRMEELERELQQVELEEKQQHKSKIQTDIISQVFATYFRILKKNANSDVLPCVLEGLAKFAHLINVEFFDDLINVLHALMESGNLSYRESLHSVLTIFKILSDQGDYLNIDPLRFYSYLYKRLLELHAGMSSGDVPILLHCLDLMFIKRRKQVTLKRVLAFIKRMSSMCLQLPHDGCIAILIMLRSMMLMNKQTDILLDNDSTQGSGYYLPELEEPEHCNPNATCLWELHSLRHHYHPLVRKLAGHVLQGCQSQGGQQVPLDLVRKSPEDLWKMFSMDEMQFTPPIPEPPAGNRKRRRVGRQGSTFLSKEIASAVETAMNEIDL